MHTKSQLYKLNAHEESVAMAGLKFMFFIIMLIKFMTMF
jgi:hypothetical protein